MEVWLAIHESGSYSDYAYDILGVYATREIAKEAIIAWAEKTVNDNYEILADRVHNHPETYDPRFIPDLEERRTYFRSLYGLDDYRWFDNEDDSEWRPDGQLLRRGQSGELMARPDYRDDWLRAEKWSVQDTPTVAAKRSE